MQSHSPADALLDAIQKGDAHAAVASTNKSENDEKFFTSLAPKIQAIEDSKDPKIVFAKLLLFNALFKRFPKTFPIEKYAAPYAYKIEKTDKTHYPSAQCCLGVYYYQGHLSSSSNMADESRCVARLLTAITRGDEKTALEIANDKKNDEEFFVLLAREIQPIYDYHDPRIAFTKAVFFDALSKRFPKKFPIQEYAAFHFKRIGIEADKKLYLAAQYYLGMFYYNAQTTRSVNSGDTPLSACTTCFTNLYKSGFFESGTPEEIKNVESILNTISKTDSKDIKDKLAKCQANDIIFKRLPRKDNDAADKIFLESVEGFNQYSNYSKAIHALHSVPPRYGDAIDLLTSRNDNPFGLARLNKLIDEKEGINKEKSSYFYFYACAQLYILYAAGPRNVRNPSKKAAILELIDAKAPQTNTWKEYLNTFFNLDEKEQPGRNLFNSIRLLSHLKHDFPLAAYTEIIRIRRLNRYELKDPIIILIDTLIARLKSSQKPEDQYLLAKTTRLKKIVTKEKMPAITSENYEEGNLHPWKKIIEDKQDDQKLTAHRALADAYFTGNYRGGIPNVPKAIQALKNLITMSRLRLKSLNADASDNALFTDSIQISLFQLEQLKSGATSQEKNDVDGFIRNFNLNPSFIEEKNYKVPVQNLGLAWVASIAILKKAELSDQSTFFDKKVGRLTEAEEKEIDTQIGNGKKNTAKQRFEFLSQKEKEARSKFSNTSLEAAMHYETLASQARQLNAEKKSSDNKNSNMSGITTTATGGMATTAAVADTKSATPALKTEEYYTKEAIYYFCEAHRAGGTLALISLGNYCYDQGCEKIVFNYLTPEKSSTFKSDLTKHYTEEAQKKQKDAETEIKSVQLKSNEKLEGHKKYPDVVEAYKKVIFNLHWVEKINNQMSVDSFLKGIQHPQLKKDLENYYETLWMQTINVLLDKAKKIEASGNHLACEERKQALDKLNERRKYFLSSKNPTQADIIDKKMKSVFALNDSDEPDSGPMSWSVHVELSTHYKQITATQPAPIAATGLQTQSLTPKPTASATAASTATTSTKADANKKPPKK